MKPLPEKIPMGAEMFADGANGYRLQQFFNPEFRVRCLSIKESREVPFVRTWSIESLPDKTFPSYEALRSEVLKCQEKKPHVPNGSTVARVKVSLKQPNSKSASAKSADARKKRVV